MSKIKSILIEIDNLTDKEQIDLWLNLFHFANDKLPEERMLNCFIIKKSDKKLRKIKEKLYKPLIKGKGEYCVEWFGIYGYFKRENFKTKKEAEEQVEYLNAIGRWNSGILPVRRMK